MQRFVEQRQSLYAVSGLDVDVAVKRRSPYWDTSTVLEDWMAVSETTA